MENLACIVFVFAVYCLGACATYHDRPFSCTTDPAAVDYFPETEIEEPAIAKPTPAPTKTIVEAMPQASFKTSHVPVKPAPIAVANTLDSLSIRELKKLASGAKIKRYSTKTKAELIICLS